MMRHISQVMHGLYLGSRDAEECLGVLQQCNITHVLTVAQALEPSHPNHCRYKVVPIPDDLDAQLLPELADCIDFIDNARATGAVLVHCEAGVSRSSSVVLAYLIARLDRTLEEAMNHLKMVRPCIQPNPNFLGQLQMFTQNREREECAVACGYGTLML